MGVPSQLTKEGLAVYLTACQTAIYESGQAKALADIIGLGQGASGEDLLKLSEVRAEYLTIANGGRSTQTDQAETTANQTTSQQKSI